MENKEFTRLTLEQGGRKIVWEVPYDDVNGEEFMDAICTIMVGATFNQETVHKCMAEWLSDHSLGKYKVIVNENADD